MILVGVDGGGTKTEFLAADGTGRILSRLVAGGCNYYSVGLDGMESLFAEATAELLSPLGLSAREVDFAVVGMPVVEENPQVERGVAEFLGRLYGRVRLHNDALVALSGSLGGAHGINVICGTGSICLGSDGQRYVRCGGWSGQFCDEGSGHWMGRKALELFTKQADGRMQRSPLYGILREHFGLERDLDITYIINHDLNQSRKKMAALQLLVAQAMAAGDPNARALYQKAGEEICLMVRTVRRQLSLKGEVRVSYAGGLFQNDALLALVKEELGSAYSLQRPLYTPAQGALILSAKQCLPESAMPAFLTNLRKEPASS